MTATAPHNSGASPSSTSRASSTMFASGTTLSSQFSSSPGITLMNPGARDTTISGTTYAWASLKLRAKLVTKSNTAAKNIENKTSNRSTAKIASAGDPWFPKKKVHNPEAATVTVIAVKLITAVSI